MAFGEPTGGNIQHMTPVEHNTNAIPGATVVDADGVVVADKDVMPIAIVDYRQPMLFVSRGLASWFGHSAPLDVH